MFLVAMHDTSFFRQNLSCVDRQANGSGSVTVHGCVDLDSERPSCWQAFCMPSLDNHPHRMHLGSRLFQSWLFRQLGPSDTVPASVIALAASGTSTNRTTLAEPLSAHDASRYGVDTSAFRLPPILTLLTSTIGCPSLKATIVQRAAMHNSRCLMPLMSE